MTFSCSYCDTEFADCHSDTDCRDILINDIYEKIITIDKHRLKMILSYIYYILM